MDDSLLVKYLLGEASEEEKRQVDSWIRSSDANRTYFLSFRSVWERSKALSITSTVDENTAWQRFRERIHQEKPVVAHRMSWIRIAALVIVLAGAAAGAYLLTRPAEKEQVQAVAGNSVRIDTLADGSVVTLNKGAALRYPKKFTGNSRRVELEGEAFFTVMPNRDHPFIVHVDGVTVEVVGTSFNVRTYEAGTEVIVETGTVRVRKKGQSVLLRPKEKLFVPTGNPFFQKESSTDQLYHYYRTRQFVCDHTPLWKLVSVLNEAYGVQIVLERPE